MKNRKETYNDSLRLDFAKRLKALRERAGLTPKMLADISEIHPVLIGRYENGHAIPRKDNLKKLAIALNVTVSDLDVLNVKTDTATQAEISAYLNKYGIKATFYNTQEERKRAGLKDSEKECAGLTAPDEGFPFSHTVTFQDIDTLQESIFIAEEETEKLFKQSRHEYLKSRLLYHLLIKKAINNLADYEKNNPELAYDLKVYLGIIKDTGSE